MSKRSSKEIKKRILQVLKVGKPFTFAQLERRLSTGFVTIKPNCEELESYGVVEIEKYDRHDANGKPFFEVRITKSGLDSLINL